MEDSNSEKCYLCPNTFTLEEHHEIPQASGGKNGPTHWLCASCHSGIHYLAHQQDPEAMFDNVLCSDVDRPKALRLVFMIKTAKNMTKDDPNKSAVFMDRFPAVTRKQLKELATLHKANQQKIVRHAIALMHNKYFR